MSDYFQDEENLNKQTGDTSQNPYGGTRQNPYGSPKDSEGTGFGIAALVLGILSLVFFCSCLTFITAPLAIIFAIVQLVRSKNAGKGLAIAGLVTGIAALAACIAFWAIAVGNSALSDSIMNEYKEYNFEDPDSIEEFLDNY